MPTLHVNSSDIITLRMNGADDQAVCLLNDLVVLNFRIAQPPISIELREPLQPGDNFLNIILINTGSSGGIDYRIDKNGNGVPGLVVRETFYGSGMVYHQPIKIVLT